MCVVWFLSEMEFLNIYNCLITSLTDSNHFPALGD